MAVSPSKLTALAVQGDPTTQTALSRIPGHLTGLKALTCGVDCTPSSMAPFGNLKQLTKLCMNGRIDDFADNRCLPKQLQVLGLNLDGRQQFLIDMHSLLQHFTSLQQLEVTKCTVKAVNIQQLAGLAPQLAQLLHIDISFTSSGCLLQTGPVWQQTRNLPSLQLSAPCLNTRYIDRRRHIRRHGQQHAGSTSHTSCQYTRFMQHLAAATSLTKLQVDCPEKVDRHTPCVAQHLARLTNLRSLSIRLCPSLTAARAQQLAGLTALTQLSLSTFSPRR